MVHAAGYLKGVEEAVDLVVAVRERRGVDLHHAGKDLLALRIKRVPRRDGVPDSR